MTKKHDTSLESSLLSVLVESERPLSIKEIVEALKLRRSTRTIQRSLSKLLANKSIYRLGIGPATRYQASSFGHIPDITLSEREYTGIIKISTNSNTVLSYISRPIIGRKPVGYNRELLDNYVPNHTWYLDLATRNFLAQVGKTHDANKPAGTYGREILHSLLVDLSWSSSRLEGNTYSRVDTQNLIDFNQYAEGKNAIEAQMILNHKNAINFMVENIQDLSFNTYTILNLHGLLSEALLHDPKDSGNLRSRIVDIGGSVYKPLSIPELISECFIKILDKAEAITDPFEQLFFILVHIPYLQAFADVNKRVSRVAANIPLIKNNLCPLTFIGLSERAYIDAYLGIYELQDFSLLRDVLVWAYERSAQEYLVVKKSLVSPDPLRIKYTTNIHALIHDIIVSRSHDYKKFITDYMQQNIPAAEHQAFEILVLTDLKNLHEGVIARYGVSSTELNNWKSKL